MDLPTTPITWTPSYRLIASRYPTVGLYDDIADPADLDAVFAIEALTNPRLRDQLGQIRLVPPEDRISGPGSTPVMAAFTHLNPEGSRFSDGQYGVYYAANRLLTAVAEVSHHRARFLARTAEPPIDIDLRLITARLDAPLHDLRPHWGQGSPWYDPASYAASQPLGRSLREAGSLGIVYRSVRDAEGECAAVFRPRALGPATAEAHIAMHWDGRQISHWYEKGAPRLLRDQPR